MSNWNRPVVFALVSALMGAASAGAAQKPKNAATLTAMDYIEIQQLVARYAYALDTAADGGDAYARLFTPDGAFVARTGHPYEIKGRAQLAAYAAGDLAHRGPAYVRDYATNYIINPAPE